MPFPALCRCRAIGVVSSRNPIYISHGKQWERGCGFRTIITPPMYCFSDMLMERILYRTQVPLPDVDESLQVKSSDAATTVS